MSLMCVEKGPKSDQGRRVCSCVWETSSGVGTQLYRTGDRCVPCLGEKYGTSGDACAFREVDARVPCVRFISLLVI